MKKNFSRFLAIALTMSMLVSAVITAPAVAFAEEAPAADVSQNTSSEKLTIYADYVANSGITNNATQSALASISGYQATVDKVEVIDDVLHWHDGNGTVTFNVSVPETALYNFKLVWRPKESGVNLNLGIMVDGQYLFDETQNAVFTRRWKNASDTPRSDVQGNEYSQEQIETGEFIEAFLGDTTGLISEPYTFALTAGTHTITLVEPTQSVEIKAIGFDAPEVVKSYAEVSSTYNLTEASDLGIITIQGEDAAIKSSSSIIPKSNNSDASMTPRNAYVMKINHIGGTSWQMPGDEIVWNFNVEKAGYYSINLRCKQSDLVNGESFRWLKIDGKTPFEEAKTLAFAYDTGWKYETLQSEEETPFYFYLEEGSHTLSMTATTGRQAQYIARLTDIVDVIGDEYIKIIMITSDTPDLNRDYELFKQIPNFTETLTKCREDLTNLANDIKKDTGKRSTQYVASMENMARVLGLMLKSPYSAQQYLSDYYSNYTALSSWLFDMTKIPLAVDEIQFVPYGQKYEDKTVGFFEKTAFGFVRFFSSFTQDYALTDNEAIESSGNERVRMWVNWGQDQTAVLSSIIQDSFTAKTGIPVQLEIVSASLIYGILSNNYPDISLHMSRTEPVNLGMRGALYDLTNFSDYEEVLKQFQPGAETPYRYGNALYALPDTQTFYMMFYRKDILEDLGLSVPKTWDEFLYNATIIQRNNMNVYVPYTQISSNSTVNSGLGSLNLFPTLMAQSGLSFYNEEQNATALNTKEAIDVFTEWTDLYKDYDLLYEADFYNRLRTGVMPLGIASYNVYMTLYSAAPEIRGRWAIATVPGNENGNKYIAGGGSGCVIVKKSKHKEAAWEFLKWWTSAETQARYSSNVESLIGVISRTATANVEGLSKLSWDAKDFEIIKEQWSYVRELPEIPGSYYLTRSIDQAFWMVSNGEATPKDAIVKWSKLADDEIERKINEYK